MPSSPRLDPYHRWLGIPLKDQPPHHYRLLGVELFESDLDVIATAADQRMTHLKTFQAGAHSAISQRLLNDVAAARVCLLNAESKAVYDRKLRASLGTRPAAAEPAAATRVIPQAKAAPIEAAASYDKTESDADDFRGDLAVSARRRASRAKKSRSKGPGAYLGAVLVIAVAALAGVFWVNANKPQSQLADAGRVAAQSSAASGKSAQHSANDLANQPAAPGSSSGKPARGGATADLAPKPNDPADNDGASAGEHAVSLPPAEVAPVKPAQDDDADDMPQLPASGDQQSVDLLKLVDPERDSVQGKWELVSGVLSSPAEPEARLQIPFEPPSDYVLTVVGERESGDSLTIGLVLGGKQVQVILDGWNRTISGLDVVDGRRANANPTADRTPNLLGDQARYTVICSVTPTSVEVNVNGAQVIKWSGKPEQLSVDAAWAVPKQDQLLIGAAQAVQHISSITLVRLPNSPAAPVAQTPPGEKPPGAADAAASADDPVKAKLLRAKRTYEGAMKKNREAMSAYFQKRQETVNKGGNQKLIDQVALEWAAFEETGELADSVPAALRKRVSSARTALEAAYTSAVKEYTNKKKEDEATQVAKELQKFKRAAADKRQYWLASDGSSFEKTYGTEWLERQRGKIDYVFDEVERNGNFIETLDRERKVGMRLYSTSTEVNFPGKQWEKHRVGKWIEPPSEPEQESQPSRVIWVATDGLRYEKTKGPEWLERAQGKIKYTFEEVDRNKSFIELLDRQRNFRVRLYAGNTKLMVGGTTWAAHSVGKWVEPSD
jgi:hypothetical protein